jgi:FMN phosphatase YigB (HAD superfamily)
MTASYTLNIKGVIFDLDGTLYKMRWFMKPLLFLRLFPHPLRLPHFLQERSRLAGKDLGSREQLLSRLCESLAVREKTSPEAAFTWIHRRFYPLFIELMRLQRTGRSGLPDVLHHLIGNGIKLAVLSDYHSVDERLSGLGIPAGCFDIITSCEMYGALKPSPRPFVEIALTWNVTCSSVLVVGDRTDTDGEAARNAGMQFLLLDDRSRDPSHRWNAVRDRLMSVTAASV